MTFISAWNLPSYSFVEVYEYFVAQKGLLLFNNSDENGNSPVFNFVKEGKKVSHGDSINLVDVIHNLGSERKLFSKKEYRYNNP